MQNSSSSTFVNFGKLQPYLDDKSVEEIWINSPNRIFIARNGKSELAPIIISLQEIRDIAERMLAWSGRRVDLSQPFVDARLPDGSRLHVAIPDITSEYWAINIRKKVISAYSVHDLISKETVNNEIAQALILLVQSGSNILVSGATHAGKTTVLNSLLGALPAGSRLITLEEVFELTPRVPDHVAMQTRQASLEGAGEVTLRTLVRESLRMRPSHLVIGEVRGAEALDLLLALNSGVPGMASIHANSCQDALRKMSALPLLAGTNFPREFAIEAVRENIDVIIHCKQNRDGKRKIVDIALVNKNLSSSQLACESLFYWDGSEYQIGQVDFDCHRKLRRLKLDLLEYREKTGISGLGRKKIQ
ncbi:MAG: CpaF family protein [Actinobacteria bacterium]|uniref:CpaF family protein n=1 Tax=Candidatus Fonsibacter lacus TaxID=2576439 RepID=A0A965GBC4_9PROT|nr:CpaF family protein [Candidatus Fonsibacter lacus]